MREEEKFADVEESVGRNNAGCIVGNSEKEHKLYSWILFGLDVRENHPK